MMQFSNTVCFVVSVAGATKSFVVDASDANDVDQVLALAEDIEADVENDYGTYGDDYQQTSYGGGGYGNPGGYEKKYQPSSYGNKYQPSSSYENKYEPPSSYENKYEPPSYGSHDYGYEQKYNGVETYDPPQYATPSYESYDTKKPHAYKDPKKEAQEDFWRSVSQCQAHSRFTECMLKCKGEGCFTGVSQYKKCTIQYANDVCNDDKMKMDMKSCKAFAVGNTIKHLKDIANSFVDAWIMKPSLANLSGSVKYSIAVQSVADEANCNAGAYWQFSKQCNLHGGALEKKEMEECMKESGQEAKALFSEPQWLKNLKNVLRQPTVENIKHLVDQSGDVTPFQSAIYDKLVGLISEFSESCKLLEIFNFSQSEGDHDGATEEHYAMKKMTLEPGCQRAINSQRPYGRYGLYLSQAAYAVPALASSPDPLLLTVQAGGLSDAHTEIPKGAVVADPSNASKHDKHAVCQNYYKLGQMMSKTIGKDTATNELLNVNRYLVELAEGGRNAEKIDSLLNDDVCYGVDSWTIEYVGLSEPVDAKFTAKGPVKLPGFISDTTKDKTVVPLSEVADYGKYYVTFEDLRVCSSTMIKFKKKNWCCKSYASVAKENGWALPHPEYNSYQHRNEYQYPNENRYRQSEYGHDDSYRAMSGHYGGSRPSYAGDGGHWDFNYGYESERNYGDSYGAIDSGASGLVYTKVFVSNKDQGYVKSKYVKRSFKHKDTSMKLTDYFRKRGHPSSCTNGQKSAKGPILQNGAVCEDKLDVSCASVKNDRAMLANYDDSQYMYSDHDYYGTKHEKYEDEHNNCPSVLQAATEEVEQCEKYTMSKTTKELQCMVEDKVVDKPETCLLTHMPNVDDLQAFLATKKKLYWCASADYSCSSNKNYYRSGFTSTAEIMERLFDLNSNEMKTILSSKDAVQRKEAIKQAIGKKDLDLDSADMNNLKWSNKHMERCSTVQNECLASMASGFVQPELIDIDPDELKDYFNGQTCFADTQGVDAAYNQAIARVLNAFPGALMDRMMQYQAASSEAFDKDDAEQVEYLLFKAVFGGTTPFGNKDSLIHLIKMHSKFIEAGANYRQAVAEMLLSIVQSEVSGEDFVAALKAITPDADTLIDQASHVLVAADLFTREGQAEELKEYAEQTGAKRVMSSGYDARPRDYGYDHHHDQSYGNEYAAGYYGDDSYSSTYDDQDSYRGGKDPHYAASEINHNDGLASWEKYVHTSVYGDYLANVPVGGDKTQPQPAHTVEVSAGYVSQISITKDVCLDLGMGSDADEMIPVSDKKCPPTACYVARYFQCLEKIEGQKKQHGKYYSSSSSSSSYGHHDSSYYGHGHDSSYHHTQEHYRALLEQAQAQASPMELAGLASLGFIAGIATVALVQQGKGAVMTAQQKHRSGGKIAASEHAAAAADQVQLV